MDIASLGSLTLVNSTDYLKKDSNNNVSDAVTLSVTPDSASDLAVITSLSSTSPSYSVNLDNLVYSSEAVASGTQNLNLNDGKTQDEQIQELINLFA